MEHYKLFIDGEFVEAASGDVFETIDPGLEYPLPQWPRPVRRMLKQRSPPQEIF